MIFSGEAWGTVLGVVGMGGVQAGEGGGAGIRDGRMLGDVGVG